MFACGWKSGVHQLWKNWVALEVFVWTCSFSKNLIVGVLTFDVFTPFAAKVFSGVGDIGHSHLIWGWILSTVIVQLRCLWACQKLCLHCVIIIHLFIPFHLRCLVILVICIFLNYNRWFSTIFISVAIKGCILNC